MNASQSAETEQLNPKEMSIEFWRFVAGATNTNGSQSIEPSHSNKISIELWKFFEERGSKLKESMFTVASWLIGLATALIAFAVKEGFDEKFTEMSSPIMVIWLSVAGLLLLLHTRLVVQDYGEHINRTFNRADAARDGETSPKKIWDAGAKYVQQKLPPVCQHLIRTLWLFAIAFLVLICWSLLTLFTLKPV